MSRAPIKPIDVWSVEQIKSGQVITSLAAAVKELVENSLDAGATVINIRIENYGLDGVSVQDNGSGIPLDDFELVARKHATSKLTSFDDLESVKTLGFRGEALASLCAIADVSMITSTGESGNVGHSVSFDHTGAVAQQKDIPAPRGTTFKISNIFETFPVRRKDFERTFKRQYEALVALIQAYALVSPVTLTLDHVTKDKARIATLRSQGTQMTERIATLFNAKLAQSLLDIDISGRYAHVTGKFSPAASSAGRMSAGRQLIYINGRPSDQKKLAKTLSEIYKQVNQTQPPFYVLNFEVDPANIDVNVSPDKREILLHHESKIEDDLRNKLPGIFGLSERPIPKQVEAKPKPVQSLISLARFSGGGKVIAQADSSSRAQSADNELSTEIVEDESDASEESEESEESEAQEVAEVPAPTDRVERSAQKPRRLVMPPSSAGRLTSEKSVDQSDVPSSAPSSRPTTRDSTTNREGGRAQAATSSDGFVSASDLYSTVTTERELEVMEIAAEPPRKVARTETHECDCHSVEHSPVESPGNETIEALEAEVKDAELKSEEAQPAALDSSSGNAVPKPLPLGQARNVHIAMTTSLDDVRALREKRSANSGHKIRNYSITDDSAEERLSLIIRKDDFANMRVIGQFNLGFILVTKTPPGKTYSELFVIDQHASDEIYNFERLQRTTVLSRQPLVARRLLELSAVEELTVINNSDIFENNGFSIHIDAEGEPGRRCFLSALPFSKGTVFNESDVHELIAQIQESPGTKSLKVSKLRAMFAMRACRSSIMIGDALDRKSMERVVRNLGTLDKPWNCPHGRPTLRHITTLK